MGVIAVASMIPINGGNRVVVCARSLVKLLLMFMLSFSFIRRNDWGRRRVGMGNVSLLPTKRPIGMRIVVANKAALKVNKTLISDFNNNEKFSAWNWVGLVLGGWLFLLSVLGAFLGAFLPKV